MKKLMMTLAAALSATALMAEVVSQNVVGYQTVSMPQGYKLVTSPFVPVGGDGTELRLGDIVPEADSTMFQFLDAVGAVTQTAIYYVGFGWYDFDTSAPLDDLTFLAGTGAYVYTPLAGAGMLIAGEVALDPLELSLPAGGYIVIGNSSPVAITLADIIPSASFDSGMLQFLDAGGAVVQTAVYYDGFGWFDFDTSAPLDDLVVGPGDAIYAYSPLAATLTFPGIDVK